MHVQLPLQELRSLDQSCHSSHSLPPWQKEEDFEPFTCHDCDTEFTTFAQVEAEAHKYNTKTKKADFRVCTVKIKSSRHGNNYQSIPVACLPDHSFAQCKSIW